MVSADGKIGRTDSNRDESATRRNHEPVGELARARTCATHWGRGLSRRDEMHSASMPPGWPKFANLRSRTIRRHVRVQPVRQRAHDFDVLHFHLDYYPFSLFSRQPTPFVTMS